MTWKIAMLALFRRVIIIFFQLKQILTKLWIFNKERSKTVSVSHGTIGPRPRLIRLAWLFHLVVCTLRSRKLRTVCQLSMHQLNASNANRFLIHSVNLISDTRLGFVQFAWQKIIFRHTMQTISAKHACHLSSCKIRLPWSTSFLLSKLRTQLKLVQFSFLLLIQ